MENNTKIAIGLAAAVVVGYIVYKSKNPKSTTSSGKCTGEFVVECNDGSCDISNGIVRPCLGKGGEKDTLKDNKGRSPYMPEVRPNTSEDDALMLKLALERSQSYKTIPK